jgi:hypothetical protein
MPHMRVLGWGHAAVLCAVRSEVWQAGARAGNSAYTLLLSCLIFQKGYKDWCYLPICAFRWVVTRVLFGWRELHPTVSAAAIAASTAAALRAPMVSVDTESTSNHTTSQWKGEAIVLTLCQNLSFLQAVAVYLGPFGVYSTAAYQPTNPSFGLDAAAASSACL